MGLITFTVRIDTRDRELIVNLAALRNQSVAELTREIIHAGLRRLLDPAEIDARQAAERARLLAAADLLDASRGEQ